MKPFSSSSKNDPHKSTRTSVLSRCGIHENDHIRAFGNGKGRYFSCFVIIINRDRDVWDELVCETQGERERESERERERLKGPDCLTDRQADGQELGIREYDSARE